MTDTTRRRRPAIFRLYATLAVLNVLTLAVMVFLHHRLAALHERSVMVNEQWGSRAGHVDELAVLAGRVTSPASDVFESGDVAGERQRLAASAAAFRRALERSEALLRHELPQGEALPMLDRLQDLRSTMNTIIVKSETVLTLLEQGHTADAAAQTAAVSRTYAKARTALLSLRRVSRTIQAGALAAQSQERMKLRRAEVAFFALIVLTLFGTYVYGRSLAGQHLFLKELEQREADLCRLNAALKASDERFALASRATTDVIWDWDVTGNSITFSNSLVTRFGYPKAGAMDVNFWFDAIHPDDRERVGASLHSALNGGEERWNDDYRYRRNDGTYAWVFDRGTILREEGKPVRMIGAILDMTDRVDAATAVSALSRQNEMILQSTAEGIFGIDLEGNTSFVNETAAAMLGHTVDELKRGRIHDLVHHTRDDGSHYPWTECPGYISLTRGTDQTTATEVFWHKDGRSIPVEYASRPIRDELGEIVGVVVSFRDISERRAVERMKDEFVSIVSHELRTPLTSIRGALGLLAGGRLGELPQKAHRMLDIAVSNTDRLVRLINDILDIERMESGKITLSRQACDTRGLLEQAADVMRPMAERAQVQLNIDACDASLFADSDRLVQTLTNLVSNAIKFSGPGTTITLSAACEPERVTFNVSDQGRGIPREKLEAIFERFQQVDASDSREKGGSGLGLAICRSIVRQHGGEIWVESEVGKGSRFRFAIPRMSATTQPKEHAVAAPPTQGRSIFVVDDDASVREVMMTLLETRGYRAAGFASGEELLAQADFAFADAILLDLNMPGMNGWQTLAALKDRSDAASVPVVIVSVLAPDVAVLGGPQLGPPQVAGVGPQQGPPRVPGVAGWVQKPLEEQTLVTALERAMGNVNRRASVMLIEDDADLARVISASFERHGIDVVHASTGGEAIELVQKASPDLLVLDLVLPGIDGFGVIDWLKDHGLLERVPLVVYSADEPSPSQRERLRLGPTEFLTKSRVSPDEFEMRVVQLLDTMTGKGEISNVA